MKKTQTLKDFLEDYIKDKSRYEGADSYKTYLMRSGSYKSSYPSAVRELMKKSRREESAYGKSGEALDSFGLLKSGYADYLTKTKNANYLAESEKLAGDYALKESENHGGYISYLEKYKKETDALLASVTQRIISAGFLDEKSAYDYAIGAGLTKSRADAAAKIATARNREKLLSAVIKELPILNLDRERAAMYAKSRGLSEREAKIASLYAESIRQENTSQNQSYLDYLESLSQQNKK